MSAIFSPLSYVYDGRDCLGFILARGKLGFEAIDRDEKSIGLFASQRAAALAIMSFPKESPAPEGNRAKRPYCNEGFNREREPAQD
jgi:hypothetical protein